MMAWKLIEDAGVRGHGRDSRAGVGSEWTGSRKICAWLVWMTTWIPAKIPQKTQGIFWNHLGRRRSVSGVGFSGCDFIPGLDPL